MTYPKLVVYCDSSFEQTYAPPEVFLGDKYSWCFLDKRFGYAYAWDANSKLPVNEYWRAVKPSDDPREPAGTIVLFRIHGAFDLWDLRERTPWLCTRKLSALGTRVESVGWN
jgi:hypothetical protein